MSMRQNRFTRRAFVAATAIAAGGILADVHLERATAQNVAGGILTVGHEGNTSFTRNFNPFSPDALWPTVVGMYDRLLLYVNASSTTVPRLCTGYQWSADGRQLTFALRPNVRWSDGQPFSARDVAFTFQLVQKILPGTYGYLGDVSTPNDSTAVFAFSRPFTPGLYELGLQLIVPEHIWKNIADPLKDPNPNPVATGPFTQVTNFQTQVYEVHKNPYYWEAGKPYIEGVRVPAYAANEQVDLAVANGDTDWADVFIPNVDKTYVSKDPAHRSYWFPKIGGTVHLLLNTTKKPFDDPNVRKAIAMAINRNQINLVAMSGYVEPAKAYGIGPRYQPWLNPAALKEGDWTTYDVAKANQLLDEAGLKRGSGGTRMLTDGSPMKYDLIVGATSTDWVASSRVVAQNLKSVGINVNVRPQDYGAVIDEMQKGQFDMAHAWITEGVTPYDFFLNAMSSRTKKPLGVTSPVNFQRFADPRADKLLDQLVATADEAQQKQIVDQLQVLYVEDAPAVSLFYGPSWGEFTTTRFTGFPSQDHPYANPSSRDITAALVLAAIKPV